MNLIEYDHKQKIIYINTRAIEPDLRGKGLKMKEIRTILGKVYDLSYEERIEKYAEPEDAEAIRQAIREHQAGDQGASGLSDFGIHIRLVMVL